MAADHIGQSCLTLESSSRCCRVLPVLRLDSPLRPSLWLAGTAASIRQRFDSAANLNIHLHCLVLDGVYRRSIDGTAEFVEAPAPTDEALLSVLRKIITPTMKLLSRRGVLVEEEGSTYVANNDGDSNEARTLRPQRCRWY